MKKPRALGWLAAGLLTLPFTLMDFAVLPAVWLAPLFLLQFTRRNEPSK